MAINQDFQNDFVTLLGRHQSQLMGYIYSLVHNLSDTEDLYQQSCIVMWQKFAEYQQGTDFVRWGCTIAHYTVANFLRQQRPRKHCFSEEFLNEYMQWRNEQQDKEITEAYSSALNGCIDRLGKSDRQVIEDRYCSGKTIKELAKQYDRSAQSLCNALGRIRTALLKCIERKLLAEERS
jgi:RNA polymerase sigma-70 factor (ECF subfamily)